MSKEKNPHIKTNFIFLLLISRKEAEICDNLLLSAMIMQPKSLEDGFFLVSGEGER
jgi:hypothetical protein